MLHCFDVFFIVNSIYSWFTFVMNGENVILCINDGVILCTQNHTEQSRPNSSIVSSAEPNKFTNHRIFNYSKRILSRYLWSKRFRCIPSHETPPFLICECKMNEFFEFFTCESLLLNILDN